MMNQSIQESFANSYPQRQKNIPTLRTPINNIYNKSEPINSLSNPSTVSVSVETPFWKLFIIVTLITLAGVIVFSSSAYTITDHFAERFKINLFYEKTGQPGYIVQTIHGLVLWFFTFILLHYFW